MFDAVMKAKSQRLERAAVVVLAHILYYRTMRRKGACTSALLCNVVTVLCEYLRDGMETITFYQSSFMVIH